MSKRLGLLAFTALLVLLTSSALAVQRTVLVELFTNTS